MIAWRLCMSLLEGSSRRIRLTRIFSSRSVNQPFLLYQVCVWVGDGTIAKTDQMPIPRVRMASMRNNL